MIQYGQTFQDFLSYTTSKKGQLCKQKILGEGRFQKPKSNKKIEKSFYLVFVALAYNNFQ